MQKMTEKGRYGYYIPAERGNISLCSGIYGKGDVRYTGSIADRLGEYEQCGYEPTDFDSLCREMSRLRLKAGCKTYEEFKKKFDYPEYILRYLRQRWDMKPDDTSRDENFQGMEPSRVFKEVLSWNGLIGGWSNQIVGWIKDIYGIDLEG